MPVRVGPPKDPEFAQALKDNAIALADHHRKHCDGESCTISLFFLLRLVQYAGIEVTDEERHHFI